MPTGHRLLDVLLHQLQLIQRTLQQARQRLVHNKDTEALHDLRISLRQLRSLLRPLRKPLAEAASLDRLAAECANPTNHCRDLEVLLIDLQAHHHPELMAQREAEWQRDRHQIAADYHLDLLEQRLLSLPLYWQQQLDQSVCQQLQRHLKQQWRKQKKQLRRLLKKRDGDWHQIRIRIKHLRYLQESYQLVLPAIANKQQRMLKQGQEILGHWHDRIVWLERSQHEMDLQVLAAVWQSELADYQQQFQQLSKRLHKTLN